MAIVTFGKSVSFPVGAVRKLLNQHLPLYSWQCGEEDSGTEQMLPWREHLLVAGRSSSTMIFTEMRSRDGRRPEPAPPHQWHVEISPPTTDLQPVADRILLILCLGVMQGDPDGALCQLLPDGNWLTAAEVARAFKLVLGGESIAIAAGLGAPADRARPAPPSAARLGAMPYADRSPQARSAILGVDTGGLASIERTFATIIGDRMGPEVSRRMGFGKPPPWMDEGVREDRLPTMVLLVGALDAVGWDEIAQGIAAVDPEGGWQVDGETSGAATLAGRGGRITVERLDEAVPEYLLEGAFSRSFWFPDGEPRLRARRHRGQLVLRCDLDTRSAPYEDVRRTAMVATLVLGIIAHRHDVAALYNAGIETIHAGAEVPRFLGVLGTGEIPIQMWTWCAPHSLQSDAVTLTSGGFAPFLGYEVEIWNAPGDRDYVVGKVNGALRYLLINGPVVRNGDTMGAKPGERSIRCFFGDSKADRAKPVRAMFLELTGPEGGGPRPDVEPAAPGPFAAPPEPEPSGPDAALLMLARFIGENRAKAGRPPIAAADDGPAPATGDAEIDSTIAKLMPGSPPEVRKALREIGSAFRDAPSVPPRAAPPGAGFGRRPGGFGRKGL